MLVQQESAPSLKYSPHLQYSTEADFHSQAFSEQKVMCAGAFCIPSRVHSTEQLPYTAKLGAAHPARCFTERGDRQDGRKEGFLSQTEEHPPVVIPVSRHKHLVQVQEKHRCKAETSSWVSQAPLAPPHWGSTANPPHSASPAARRCSAVPSRLQQLCSPPRHPSPCWGLQLGLHILHKTHFKKFIYFLTVALSWEV